MRAIPQTLLLSIVALFAALPVLGQHPDDVAAVRAKLQQERQEAKQEKHISAAAKAGRLLELGEWQAAEEVLRNAEPKCIRKAGPGKAGDAAERIQACRWPRAGGIAAKPEAKGGAVAARQAAGTGLGTEQSDGYRTAVAAGRCSRRRSGAGCRAHPDAAEEVWGGAGVGAESAGPEPGERRSLPAGVGGAFLEPETGACREAAHHQPHPRSLQCRCAL